MTILDRADRQASCACARLIEEVAATRRRRPAAGVPLRGSDPRHHAAAEGGEVLCRAAGEKNRAPCAEDHSGDHLEPEQRALVGVVNPIDPHVETP